MKKLVLCTAISAVSISAYGDLADKQAEETLVTAARTPQTLAETLSSVTVFSREDIEKYQATDISELMSKVPGISITRNGGRGSSTSVSLRGNQSDHTLFLIDGVRVGSATLGSTSIESLDPEMIERIEVVRGPKSSLYGSDALGGVVNIITRQASKTKPVVIKAGIGANNSDELSLSAGLREQRYQVNATASYEYYGGYDNTASKDYPHNDDDAYRKTSLGLTGAYSLTKAIDLGLTYQYSESESEYDTVCTNSTSYLPVICSPYSDNEQEAINLNVAWAITSIWQSSLDIGRSKDESETLADDTDISLTFSGGEFNTEKTDISWLNYFKLTKNFSLTAGYDFLNEKVSGTTDYEVDQRDNEAVYAQLDYQVSDASFNVGARRDDNEQFDVHETYNATVAYQLNGDMKLVANYGEAFKAPSFNDLYYPNFGDPTMVPEESEAYELSLRTHAQNMTWSISAYKNNITNLIQYNPAIFANDQLASATIKGLEFALATTIFDWSVNSAITLLDTEDDKTGNHLARRPEKVLNIDVDRSFGDISVGATFYTADSRYNDAANTSELSGYATVALRGAYQINDEFKLQLKVDNLFDKDYVITESFNLGEYKQPGREMFVSIVYTPQF